MRVQKKERQVREVEVVIEDYNVCDHCGKKIENDTYDAFEFDLTYKTGEAYPEAGFGKQWEMELCSKCAPKAIKLLRENGFRATKKDWDY